MNHLLTRLQLAEMLQINPRSVDRHWGKFGIKLPGARGLRWSAEAIYEFIAATGQTADMVLRFPARGAEVYSGRIQHQGGSPGRLSKNGLAIEFNSASIASGTNKRRNYINEIDLFAVYCPQNYEIYIVPIEKVNNYRGILRLIKNGGSQDNNIMYGEDFLIGKFKINSQKKQSLAIREDQNFSDIMESGDGT